MRVAAADNQGSFGLVVHGRVRVWSQVTAGAGEPLINDGIARRMSRGLDSQT